MEKSWFKRSGLVIAGFILRLFGMKLIGESLPADEYAVKASPYRTATPPKNLPANSLPKVTRSKPRRRLRERLFQLVPKFMRNKDFYLTVLLAVTAVGLGVTLWGIWYLINQDIPEIVSYQLTPDATDAHEAGYQPWIISLPFAVSRLWDLAFLALLAVAVGILANSYKKEAYLGDAEKGVLVSAGIGSSILGLFTFLILGLDNHVGIASGVGALAGAMITVLLVAVIASIISLLNTGLTAGLRTGWFFCLAVGVVACIFFGAPGGVLFGFVSGVIISLLNVLVASFVSLLIDKASL